MCRQHMRTTCTSSAPFSEPAAWYAGVGACTGHLLANNMQWLGMLLLCVVVEISCTMSVQEPGSAMYKGCKLRKYAYAHADHMQ
jgi:hypothetical protein